MNEDEKNNQEEGGGIEKKSRQERKSATPDRGTEKEKITLTSPYQIALAPTLAGHWYSISKDGAFVCYVPSVTTYLNAYPTSEQLVQWIAQQGFHESRVIRDEAGRAGTKIHATIERLLEGEEIDRLQFTLEEWYKLNTFVAWYNEFHPEIIATEFAVFSPTGQFAGRVDCIAKIAGEVYVIDWKSSRSIHASFPLQFAAYAHAIEEMTDLKIDNTACVQMGAANKNGYRFVPYPDWREHYETFEHVRATWQYDNKFGLKEPPVLVLPDSIKLL